MDLSLDSITEPQLPATPPAVKPTPPAKPKVVSKGRRHYERTSADGVYCSGIDCRCDITRFPGLSPDSSMGKFLKRVLNLHDRVFFELIAGFLDPLSLLYTVRVQPRAYELFSPNNKRPSRSFSAFGPQASVLGHLIATLKWFFAHDRDRRDLVVQFTREPFPLQLAPNVLSNAAKCHLLFTTPSPVPAHAPQPFQLLFSLPVCSNTSVLSYCVTGAIRASNTAMTQLIYEAIAREKNDEPLYHAEGARPKLYSFTDHDFISAVRYSADLPTFNAVLDLLNRDTERVRRLYRSLGSEQFAKPCADCVLHYATGNIDTDFVIEALESACVLLLSVAHCVSV